MEVPLDQLPKEWQEEFQRLSRENQFLRLKLRLTLIKKFGPKSEKLSDQQLQLLQIELSVTEAEVATEIATEVAQTDQRRAEPTPASVPQPKPRVHPGRTQLPAHLERRELIIACPAEERLCPHCQKEKVVIGYEESEELACQPVVYFVRLTKREKRACPDCPEGGVQTAPCPAKIIPKGKLGNEVVVDALLNKFDAHIPVFRQCAILKRDTGIEWSRQTLNSALISVGGLLEPMSRLLAEDLKAGSYIQVDETTVACQSERTRGRNHLAYLWEYSRPGGSVVFDFRMGRSRDGPALFLKGFQGKLQCDGYGAYDKLGERITYVGCMSHVRRGFHDAHMVAKEDPRPLRVLGVIAQLYAVEEQARAKGMNFAQRLALRQQQSQPVMTQLQELIISLRQEALPASPLGKACSYALGQWKRLLVFLEDGQVEIDNNWCENAMRPIALGRKNWLHIGSEEAGPKIAAIASVMETCRRLGINRRDYLSDVLAKLGDWPINRLGELTPLSWKTSRVQ
jgi:transposase